MNTFETIEEIYHHAKLKTNTNPIKMETSGLSSAKFYKYDSVLFLKEVNFKNDALSIRTNDQGREFHLLSNGVLDPLWNIVNNPYQAFAIETDRYALLMHYLKDEFSNLPDFITHLHPIFIKNLAKIHAVFWNHDGLRSNHHLLGLHNYTEMLGPKIIAERNTQRINLLIENGWKKAKTLLSKQHYELFMSPQTFIERYSSLPCTFIHGDYRPNNIGYSEKNQVITLIDFAFSGFAPCTVDLFWYIATTTWLGVNYEETIDLYRTELEKIIGKISEPLWHSLLEIGIFTVCCMQLWEKALDYDKDPSDFMFWINKLTQI